MRISFEFFIDRLAGMHRNFHGKASPLSWLALDLQMAAHRLRSLAHIEESEMSRGRRLAGGKTLAIVTHGQANGHGRVSQFDGDLLRAAGLHGIAHSFLPD